jgi:hypothetical protein
MNIHMFVNVSNGLPTLYEFIPYSNLMILNG